MEGAGAAVQTSEALRTKIAIRCAKATLLLCSLNRRLNAAIDFEDVSEKEMLKKEIRDLKMEVAKERLRNKRIEIYGLSQLVLLLLLLLVGVSTFFFMLAFGNGSSFENGAT